MPVTMKSNSDARKAQNRIASRTYRLKKKQKLDLLDQLLAQAQQPIPEADDASASNIPQVESSQASTQAVLSGGAGANSPQFAELDPFPPDLFSGIWDGYDNNALDMSDIEGTRNALDPDSFTSQMAQLEEISFASVPEVALCDPASLSLSTAPVPVVRSQKQMQKRLWRPSSSTKVPDLLGAVVDTSDGNRQGDNFMRTVGTLESLTTSQKRCLLEVIRIQLQAKSTDVEDITETENSALSSSQPGEAARDDSTGAMADQLRQLGQWLGKNVLPNVRVNAITLSTESAFAAYLSNAAAVGLVPREALFLEEAVSPFSLTQDEGHECSQLAVVRSRFAAVPEDLRPVDGQLTLGHHPYLDVIPFVSFRTRVCAALAADPPLIDEDALCSDLCIDGLVCWSAQGKTGGGGAPWEARSWEARPWFLRKWWFLCGGWEDEMWRSTRWWHALRGEMIEPE